MRRLLAVCVASVLLLSASSSGAEDSLAELVRENSRPIVLEDGALGGPGAEWLVERASEADYLLFGEQHATAEIAEVATALFERLAAERPTVAAVEVGPWSTPVLERLLREGTLEDYLTTGGRELVFPFFFFAEEAEFGRTVVRLSGRESRALWGVDQEFVAGAPVILDLLEDLAAKPEERAAVAAAREKADENPMFLGAGEDSDWSALVEAFSSGSPEARRLLDEVLLSRRIYGPFVGRGGSVQAANAERERYMKTWFQSHLERARAESGPVPAVFLKFGANHVAYGHSPTHVLTLGTFVHETAIARGETTFGLHVDCAGGEVRDPRSGQTSACRSYFLGPESDLTELLTPGEVVDLRALRPRTDLWEGLDERSRRLILAADAYLAVDSPRAATLVGSSAAAE